MWQATKIQEIEQTASFEGIEVRVEIFGGSETADALYIQTVVRIINFHVEVLELIQDQRAIRRFLFSDIDAILMELIHLLRNGQFFKFWQRHTAHPISVI